MTDAIGSKNTCRTFSTELFDWWIQSKKSSFSTGATGLNSQPRKVESKKPFFDFVRKPDLGFSRERPFSTDNSDCIRNGQPKKKCKRLLYWQEKIGNTFQKDKTSIAKHCALGKYLDIRQCCHHNALRLYSNPSQQQQQGGNRTPTLSME